MKSNHLLVALVLLFTGLALTGCSSDKSANASDLLKTVPSDASLVAVANIEALLNDAGCTVDGYEVKPSDSATAFVNSVKNENMRSLLSDFITGKSGVDPSVTVLFKEGYYFYCTGLVANTDDFKAAAAKRLGGEFKESGGVETLGPVAICNNQFWISENNSIDPLEIKHFTTLADDQSFISNGYADKLKEIKSDIEGWGNLSGMLNTGSLSFQQRATVQVALQTLFDDANAFTFTLNFNKGEMNFVADILNAKGKPAKFLFPTEKINPGTVASLGGTAGMVCAMAISSDFVKKLQKETSGNAPSMLGVYAQLLSPVNGTVAFATDGNTENINGVITTDGSNAGALVSALKSMDINAKTEGKLLRINKGDVKGGLQPANDASLCKDAMFVVIADPNAGIGGLGIPGFRCGVLSIVPSDDSVKVKFNAISSDKEKNALLTILNQR
ncbi:MAG: hypothetical protein NC204_00145 [Candidatus Amulumruptor caecigallinarius]|nr:hypothetical protein [Candidatus Amulumruptor caecigallinarius]